jgi:hypothetical protein
LAVQRDREEFTEDSDEVSEGVVGDIWRHRLVRKAVCTVTGRHGFRTRG